MRFLSIGISSLLLLLAIASARPTARSLHLRDVSTSFPDPNDDPFYKAPSNVNSYKPGQIIRTRSVNTTITSFVGSSFQLLYRTTDTQNKSEVTVATVWAPTTPKSPPQVFSYQSYMDSDSLDCDPSWAFVSGSASQGKPVTSLDAPIYIEWALSTGRYVVDADDEGPKAAFIAGFQQGQAALDGIRALKNHYNLPKSTEIALNGYSGGASVTVWAVNLAQRYAPELNIVGAAFGGTPIDARGIYNFLNADSLFGGFAGAGLVGLMSAYPQLNSYVLNNVDANTKALIAQYRSRNYCIGQVATAHPFTNFSALINVPDPLNQPIVKAVLARESLLMEVSSVGVSVPTFPRLEFHALEDEIVPYADELKYVQEQCAHGANIQFQTFPVAEHITAELLGIAGSIQFLEQAFSKTTPKVICGAALPTFPSLFSPAAVSILGQSTVDSLLRLNGTKVGGETINLYKVL